MEKGTFPSTVTLWIISPVLQIVTVFRRGGDRATHNNHIQKTEDLQQVIKTSKIFHTAQELFGSCHFQLIPETRKDHANATCDSDPELVTGDTDKDHVHVSTESPTKHKHPREPWQLLHNIKNQTRATPVMHAS
jgi:hypothetical protein